MKTSIDGARWKRIRYERIIHSMEDEFNSNVIHNLISNSIEKMQLPNVLSNIRFIEYQGKFLEIRKLPSYHDRYCAIHLAYPKPVYTKILPAAWPGFGISYSLPNLLFRKIQFDYLSHIKKEVSFLNSADYFDLLHNLIGEHYSAFYFVDPFSHLGDSFIGLNL